jgi:hypothetical protein
MLQKFEFYIISLFFLFFLLFITKVPYSFDANSHFIGFESLISDNIIISICIGFMCLAVFFFFRFKYKFEQGSSLLPAEVLEIENVNYESVTFLATYIIPLACIDMDKARSPLLLIVILILIGWIYIKTNLFYTNPTLAIWGYHIYKISTSQKKDIIIISKQKVNKNDMLYLKNIDDKIFISKKQL